MFIFKKAEKEKKTLRDNDIMRTVINFQLKEFENIRKYGNFVGSKKKNSCSVWEKNREIMRKFLVFVTHWNFNMLTSLSDYNSLEMGWSGPVFLV